MYRITNTAEDRSKSLLHRTAAKFELEPVLGSQRIRLRESITITDAHYEQVKDLLQEWVSKGMVDVTKVEDDAAAQIAGFIQDRLQAPPAAYDLLPPVPVVEEPAEIVVNEPAIAKLDLSDVSPPVEAAPVLPVIPAPPEDKSDPNKKGPAGKKKLF